MATETTRDFLQKLLDRIIIHVVPDNTIQDKVAEILESAIIPESNDDLFIFLSNEGSFKVEYTKWCHKQISLDQTFALISLFRKKKKKDSNLVRIIDDPFKLLSPLHVIVDLLNDYLVK